ncbi:ABC transporter permease [Peijinzhouia sedimentorum]
MFLNYLKITLRSLQRNKGYASINILGLAIGMAGAMLILLWIQHEVSFDRFHTNGNRLYEAYHRVEFDGILHSSNYTSEPMGPALAQEYPETEETSRYDFGYDFDFTIEQLVLTQPSTFVDPSFLQMFSFPLEFGNAQTALSDPYSIILTASTAEKLFGVTNALGKTILLDDNYLVTVTGVLSDLPTNTRFSLDAVLSWELRTIMGIEDQSPHNWSNSYVNTFVLLKENTDFYSFNEKIKDMSRNKDEIANFDVFLYPSKSWHLFNRFENGSPAGGRIDRVYMFGAIALFILLIACINFMNLSTARSEKRAKEVGIRKTIGAERYMLIYQFISESVLLTFVSGILALGITILVLPFFSTLIGQQFEIPFEQGYFWVYFISFILFTGFIAGSYPAFFLSSFRAATVLKGTHIKINSAFNPRKLLVVLQFSFAIGLILCTLIIKEQINHAESRDVGYNRDQLITIYLNEVTRDKIEIIRNDLVNSNSVLSSTRTSAAMTRANNSSYGIDWEGKNPDDRIVLYRFGADKDWVKTTEVTLIAGRDIDAGKFASDSTAMLVNETAARLMGYSDPIGKKVEDNYLTWTIVGVFKDFMISSPYNDPIPLIVEGPAANLNVLTVRLNGERETQENIAQIESVFKEYDPDHLLQFEFVDQKYAEKFSNEQQTAKLTSLFSSLAIAISCLGLFGLAAYTAEQKRKEIGVRKVLGASVSSIVYTLTYDFVRLVIISFLIATPIAYAIMQQWLNSFSYKTSVSIFLFLAVGLLSLFIAIVTVIFQSLNAARQNPVDTLMNE